jgi:two-component system, OmpR family, sensor histidine kinase KdpD
MNANPGTTGEHAGTRSSSRAVLRQSAGPWQVFLFTGLAWLLIAVIVLQFTLASAAAAGALVGVAVLLCASGESLITSADSCLPPRSRLAGYAMAAVLVPVLTLLAGLRGRLSLTTDALTFLVAVIAVALARGLAPSVLESIAGSLLVGFYLTAPVDNSAITEAGNPAVLGVFAAVALVVSILAGNAVRHGKQASRAIAESELLAAAAASILLGPEALAAVLDQARAAFGMESVTLLERDHSASGVAGGRAAGWTPVAVSGGPPLGRPGDAAVAVPATDSLCLAVGGRTPPTTSRSSLGAFAALAAAAVGQQRLAAAAEAARPIAHADRMRTALLAAVSHDLRTPLAAAKAAVSCLRSADIQLTAADQDELLATAEESLDLLTNLVASLLDVSRLQAGALPVFPRPADLQEIIARSFNGIGPQAEAVMVDVPRDLPQVMVDPPIMERVIANVTANALRYSPGGSPPLLAASARGDRVELRVVDRGPGVAQADRDRMFAPFERLGDAGTTTGVGLGLAVSRGLTEAMAGTLEPEQTPGGGLTMAISVPAVPGPARACPGSPGSRERERIGIDPTPSRDHHGAPAWHGAGVTVSRSPASRRSRACYAPCWPAGQCHRDIPGYEVRAEGSGAGALQTWFGPLGRPERGVVVTWYGLRRLGREIRHGHVR